MTDFQKKQFNQILNYLVVSNLKLRILLVFGRDEVKFKRIANNKEKKINKVNI